MSRVGWDVVCRPRHLGGLGVADLRIKNKALLSKWMWRYAQDCDSLWRRLITAKYGVNIQWWRFNTENLSAMSGVWKQIVLNSCDISIEHHMGMAGFQWKIGNGKMVLFWFDPWVTQQPLKDIYPRLFMLSINKLAWIHDYVVGGMLEHGQWTSFFRRQLRGFELDRLHGLQELVRGVPLWEARQDMLIWRADAHGIFSVKALSKLLLMDKFGDDDLGDCFAWNVLVPPKVQAFLWFIWLRRLPTADFLRHRGLSLSAEQRRCSWCELSEESIAHLFYECPNVLQYWVWLRNWWNVSTPFPVSFTDFFVEHLHCPFMGSMKRLWVACVSALLWSLWLARNERIFRGKCLTMEEICFLVKLRSFYWIKVGVEGESLSEAIWWTCPSTHVFSVAGKKVRRGVFWQPPVMGVLKFNIDGVARGKPGPAGFGGVMRDGECRILGLFSGPLGVMDSNVAEIRAIAFSLSLVVEGSWRHQCLITESDSQVALSWVTRSAKRPWRLWDVFMAIDQARQVTYELQFCYVPREANGFSDVLAKEGVDRVSLFVACL
ncbi:hypothetical protein like AT4G29090 [Hibiscus trionum]|uniref:RNase H type-1 domain-containing protein n=1 Tax=Hibiscus trionum TaxID=183268 RepID=A0A9W7IU00_HIBTR|nr:hypothetical protein like AT4G29090 [Hibiscus trionum]